MEVLRFPPVQDHRSGAGFGREEAHVPRRGPETGREGWERERERERKGEGKKERKGKIDHECTYCTLAFCHF